MLFLPIRRQELLKRPTAMYTETDITQPQRLIPRMMQEMSFFAFPIGVMAEIHLDSAATIFSTLLTAIMGAIAGYYAIGYYKSQTGKSNVERRLAEKQLELVERELEKFGNRKPKKEDGED